MAGIRRTKARSMPAPKRSKTAAPRAMRTPRTATAAPRALPGTKQLAAGFLEQLSGHAEHKQKALRRDAMALIRAAPLPGAGLRSRAAPTRATGRSAKAAAGATRSTRATTAASTRATGRNAKAAAGTRARTGKAMPAKRARTGKASAAQGRAATASAGPRKARRTRRTDAGQSGGMMEPRPMGTALHSAAAEGDE